MWGGGCYQEVGCCCDKPDHVVLWNWFAGRMWKSLELLKVQIYLKGRKPELRIQLYSCIYLFYLHLINY